MTFSRKYSAVLVAAVLSWVMVGAAPLPQVEAPIADGALKTDNVRMDMAFKATFPDQARADIYKFFGLAEFKMGQKWSSVALNDLLVAQRTKILAADPAYFTNLSKHIAELTVTAQKDIDQQLSTKFAAAYGQACERLKADLEKDQPAFRWRAKYVYAANSREHGDPGWLNPPEISMLAGEAHTCAGTVELDDIELAVPGTTIRLPIQAKLSFSVSTTFDIVDGNICESARDVPESVIGATPILVTKAVLDVASNGSIATDGTFLHLACTKRFELARDRANLIATPTPKEAS